MSLATNHKALTVLSIMQVKKKKKQQQKSIYVTPANIYDYCDNSSYANSSTSTHTHKVSEERDVSLEH